MQKLVFVYNANSGSVNALLDGLHKAVSPKTYQCQLCALTYGSVKMHEDWKDFVKSLPYDVEIIYKNQLPERYPNVEINVPAIFSLDEDGPAVVVSAEEFDKITDLDELVKTVEKKLGL